MKAQKTHLAKTFKRLWHEVDVSKLPVGRISTQIATVLRGKHKRDFTPNIDMGDFVVAVNAGKLKFTGRKLEQKKYYRHSGYLGGLKTKFLKHEVVKNPEKVLRTAVKSMLDEVKFRKKILTRLKIVKDKTHNFKIDKVW